MPKKKVFVSNVNDQKQIGGDLERWRLLRLLETAMRYPLTVVCAGSGYGKTRAVYSFLQKYDAAVTWLQISERDNMKTHFWENYANTVSKHWPESGKHLAEIGFPDTEDRFDRIRPVIRAMLDQQENNILVIDDFHFIQNPEVFRFVGNLLNYASSDRNIIIISHTIPNLNLVGMMMSDRVFIIDEELLRFSEDEIAEYFGQLNLSATRIDISNVYNDTQGWAFAVNMIGRSLIRERIYERHALDAMKKNIFRLIESEILEPVSYALRNFLLRVSLIGHLAAPLIRELAGGGELIGEMENLHAYIRYDFNRDTYMIHHLLLEYLRQQQQTLTTEEKNDTWKKAGDWCEAYGYHTDAFSYYRKAGNYEAIIRKIVSLGPQTPKNVVMYALEILDGVPDEVKFSNLMFPGMHLRLMTYLGRFDDKMVDLANRYIEGLESKPESPERNRALSFVYASLAIIRAFVSTCNDIYDFDVCYEKMRYYHDKSPFKVVGKYETWAVAWATLVGASRAGAMEAYIDAVSRSVPHMTHMGIDAYVGLCDLLRGELAIYRWEFDDAEQHLKQAVDKARAHNQYTTHAMALLYTMKMAFCRGDLISATGALHEAEQLLGKDDYDTRFETYDTICGSYYIMVGQAEQVPDWLKGDFLPYTHPAFPENSGNRVKLMYHYQTRQYAALLAYIESMEDKETLLFQKIDLKVLQALCLYQLNRRPEAIAALTEAYIIGAPNRIITSFVKHGKDMRTLTGAALRDNACEIPKEWLEGMSRKASTFAKRANKTMTEYRLANEIDQRVSLSNREIEVLKELSQGLSRAEIADNQKLSVNTVKTVISIIRDKLCVNSTVEAVRVAAELKII